MSFPIPSDWLSGVYISKLSQSDVPEATQSYVIFVLRDERRCDFLFKCSDATWSAYKPWPDRFSLYDFHGEPQKEGYWGPGVQVSWDRPYAMSKPWYGLHEPEPCGSRPNRISVASEGGDRSNNGCWTFSLNKAASRIRPFPMAAI